MVPWLLSRLETPESRTAALDDLARIRDRSTIASIADHLPDPRVAERLSRFEPADLVREAESHRNGALFVLVGSLVKVGVIGDIGESAANWMGERELLGATVLLFGSGVLGAFVDNIPYTTAMVPIVEEMVAATPSSGAESPLWWALVFGADLGGNATAVAAGANVVVLGIAMKAGERISFWEFTKYGVVTTVATLLAAWLYVYLRYFVLV